jgi:two-component system response regulator HydG
MKTEEIIIVEDNSVMRLGISESLRRDGHSIISCDNGPDALNYFKQNNIPIAIVDLKMQPIDGIEVLRTMKEINPSTEVLMISAFGTVESELVQCSWELLTL